MPAWLFLGLVFVLLLSWFVQTSRARPQTRPENPSLTVFAILVAILAGLILLIRAGSSTGMRYFAAGVTEVALSVDDMVVFLLLMSSFAVPRYEQRKALFLGIAVALPVRLGLILLGGSLLNAYTWAFVLFGLILLINASGAYRRLSRSPAEARESVVVRIAQALVRTSENYDGGKLTTFQEGRRHATALVPVIVAIAGTDIVFGLDAVPATLGIAQDVGVVVEATILAQFVVVPLYFLINHLLRRLVYFSYAVAGIQVFIAVKVFLQALDVVTPMPEIPVGLSLALVVSMPLTAIVASLVSWRARALTYASAARRLAREYLDIDTDPDYTEEIYHRLLAEESRLVSLPERHQAPVREDQELMDLLERAHRVHEQRVATGDGSAR